MAWLAKRVYLPTPERGWKMPFSGAPKYKPSGGNMPNGDQWEVDTGRSIVEIKLDLFKYIADRSNDADSMEEIVRRTDIAWMWITGGRRQ
jgi:hypothetical protein